MDMKAAHRSVWFRLRSSLVPAGVQPGVVQGSMAYVAWCLRLAPGSALAAAEPEQGSRNVVEGCRDVVLLFKRF